MKKSQNSNMYKVLFLISILIGCQATEILNSVRNENTEFVQFYLFTKANIEVPVVLNNNNIATIGTSTPFTAAQRTVFIVHGHRGSWRTTLNPLVKDALLGIEGQDLNVIVVDWSLSADKSYNEAVVSTANVAAQVSALIDTLVDATCGTGKCVISENLHLIGFGLGAHIVGRAARESDGQIGRITGLDPSGKNWGTNTPRLTKTDALYVEVIHTDGTGILANGIGIALGHVDFFVNGGCNQPGCVTHACSHNRAYELFAASLRDELTGRQCKSNLQLTMNLCDRKSELDFGNNELDKLKGDDTKAGIYRINTSWKYP